VIAPARPLILRIITRLAGGGPPVHATILNRQLEQFGFSSVLAFGACAAEERSMEYLLKPGDRVERISSLGPNPNPFRDFLALFQLWVLMRRHRPAIVHTHTAKAGFLGRIAAVFAGVPCVVHTYHGHVLEGYFSPMVNRILCLIERCLGHFSTALCTVSQQQAEELTDRFEVAPKDKFHVVPLGLDLAPFLALPPPDFESRTLTIGWLGRFVPIKNMPLLLDVVTGAAKRGLPLQFLIAGDGPERAWLEEEILERDLRNVRVLPWQDQVEQVIEKCHLLILTSHREGTPLALIQGMAAGRPFLSTPAGGTVDLASGVCRPRSNFWRYDNSVLVRPHSEHFLEALEELLRCREDMKSLSSSSQDFARRSFGELRLVSDVADLYRSLLQGRCLATLPAREAHT
jgi:glycosyltransferase involved in cell wall biosynthesis